MKGLNKKILDKRRNILQAALELIAENGFHGAPMAAISEKAGVAAGTIYRYFESKDVLITELHRELEDRIMVALQEGYPSEGPLRERFLHLFREILQYFMMNPFHFRFLEQYFNSPYGISLRRDRLLRKPGNYDILMDIFEQGSEQKVLKDFPKIVMFSLAFGPLTSLIRDHTLGFVNLDETLIKQITEACWDTIKR
ncbi:MAG: TetR/AcrR family transcriptional regulator [Deltaproteobacteria bacterium]|nr:TetR/AcrR family transcriptional regulator [Deltaproteobacteria bacterium]